ncbi:MAG: TonB-dependent receptor [Steroidobacteraceae bacterium]
MEGDDRARSYRALIDQTLAGVAGFDQIEWRAYWQQASVDQRTFEQRRAVPPRTPAADISRSFDYSETTIGTEITLARDITVAGLDHRFVFGGEAARSRITEARDGLQTSLPSGVTTKVLLGETMPVRDFPRSTTSTFGVYLQDEFRPGGGRLAVLPALRLDHYRLRPNEDALYLEDNPRQTPVSTTHTSLTPRLGVTWRVADRLAVFGQYVRGFRSPPFSDVNIGLDIAQFNFRAIPNPDLKPEKSNAFELGLRSTHPGLTGSLSLFYTRYRDFIESKVNLGVDPATGTTLFQSRNLARAEIYGAEAEGIARLGEWNAALAPWTVRFALSYARGNDLERNRPLNSIDPLKAVVGVRYTAPNGVWDAELLTTAVAAKDRVSDGATSIVRTDGFVTLDLLAEWRITGRLSAQAGLFNLTDRSYLEWTDVRDRAASDPLLELYRRPGRNGSVSFTYRY